jgi:hypothetical protein
MWEGLEPPPSRAGTAPLPARGACGRAAPPCRSQPPRGGLTSSRPWGGAGASAALPGGRLKCGARARLHLHPSGLTASRLGPHRSSSSLGGTRSCRPPRPLRLARAAGGGASRAARSQGPAQPPPTRPSPFPRAGPRSSPRLAPEAPSPSRSPRLAAQLTAPSRFRGPRPLRRPPRRRRAQGSRAASSAPPLRGSRLLRRVSESGGVGAREKKGKGGKKIHCFGRGRARLSPLRRCTLEGAAPSPLRRSRAAAAVPCLAVR